MNTETKPKFQDAIASVQKAVDQAARVSKITQEMKEAGIYKKLLMLKIWKLTVEI